MADTDMLHCPFCGCTEVHRMEQDADAVWYECDDCLTTGPLERGGDGAAAKSGWNHRAVVSRESRHEI